MFPVLGADEGQEDDPRYLRWRRRNITRTIATLASMAGLFAVLRLLGVSPIAAAVWCILIIYAGVVVVNSSVEIFAPARYERWRRREMEGSPNAYANLGQGFDGLLGLGDSRDPDHPYRRLRLFGAALLLTNGVVIAAVIWVCSLAGWI